MGRSTRRRWGPVYVRGLLGPDGPKSVQPIAARLGLRGHDQLHHFISSRSWDDAPLWRVLAEQADAIVGGDDAVLVVDDTALPKKGTLSVGVAPQYCGELGKQANCQSLVSLTLARAEVPVPIGLRLFLPKSWTDDEMRCATAGVPEMARTALTKPEIALKEIDRVRAGGIRFGCVLADAGYGLSAPFRQGLSTRGLVWSVRVPRTQRVFTTGVGLLFPRANKESRASTPCPAKRRGMVRTFWMTAVGGASLGVRAAKVRSPPASRLCACGSPTGLAARATATCPARRSGWWVNGAAAVSGNTT